MPSKAKKIEVGSASMLGLKALVSEQEEASRLRQQQKGGDLRRYRGEAALNAASASAVASSRDIFTSRSNRGIEERSAADEVARAEAAARRSKTRAADVLSQKAELYDRLKRGEIDPEAAKAAGFLVEFDAADHTESAGGGELGVRGKDLLMGFGQDLTQREETPAETTQKTAAPPTLPRGMVEIEDEFGREMVVAVGSSEHGAFIARQAAATRANAGDGSQRSYEDWERDPKRHRGSSGCNDSGGGGQQWPVSNGAGRSDCGEWERDPEGEAAAGRGLGEFCGGGDSGPFGGPVSVGGRVKSKWEQTLSSEEKQYLAAISAETAVGRAKALSGSAPRAQGADSVTPVSSAPVKRDLKAERREMLRKKIEAREKASGGGK